MRNAEMRSVEMRGYQRHDLVIHCVSGISRFHFEFRISHFRISLPYSIRV
jgi:hypothetical protein